jgi:hypothetical protein
MGVRVGGSKLRGCCKEEGKRLRGLGRPTPQLFKQQMPSPFPCSAKVSVRVLLFLIIFPGRSDTPTHTHGRITREALPTLAPTDPSFRAEDCSHPLLTSSRTRKGILLTPASHTRDIVCPFPLASPLLPLSPRATCFGQRALQCKHNTRSPHQSQLKFMGFEPQTALVGGPCSFSANLLFLKLFSPPACLLCLRALLPTLPRAVRAAYVVFRALLWVNCGPFSAFPFLQSKQKSAHETEMPGRRPQLLPRRRPRARSSDPRPFHHSKQRKLGRPAAAALVAGGREI